MKQFIMRWSANVVSIGALFACLWGGAPFDAIAQTGDRTMGPKLEVSPQQVLIGDPISVKVSGLSAGQLGTLTASGHDQFGNL